MSRVSTKPVVSTGFVGFVAASLLQTPVFAQEYIDVEAEREAARREAVVSTTPPAVDSGSADTGAIRPYSGQTTAVVPVDAGSTTSPVPSGAGDVGDLVVQVQQLQEEVRRLNGQVEEQAAQLRRLKEQGLERYIDIDRRLAELSGSLQGTGSGPAAPNQGSIGQLTFGGGAAAEAPQQAPKPGEEAAYQAAYGNVKARNFPVAVDAFQGFLASYPFGRYAPNAHYWLGELYLVVKPPDPELARQSFKLLLDQYPDNPKVPDALYKLGKVHYLKGNSERSREYLDRVTETYPGHPASQLALDFIADNF